MTNHNFVIFGMGRTGSSLLASLLNSHPLICCEGEIFRLGRWRRRERPLARVWQYYPQPYIFYRRLRAQILLSKTIYGFKLHSKLHTSQLVDTEGFLHTAHQSGWKIIHLERASLFDQVLSGEVGGMTGRFFSHNRGPAPSGQVTISGSRFGDNLEKASVIRADHRRILSEISHTTVVYEDDLAQEADWLNTIIRICEYLEVPAPSTVETHVQKPWNSPYSELVTNYDELVELSEMYARKPHVDADTTLTDSDWDVEEEWRRHSPGAHPKYKTA